MSCLFGGSFFYLKMRHVLHYPSIVNNIFLKKTCNNCSAAL